MYSVKKSRLGFTIVEIMLVLAIGMSILYLSLRQYTIWQRGAEIQVMKANVDVLFAAASKYYRAHCDDPANFLGDATSNPWDIVSIDTLVQEGFLSRSDLHPSKYVSYGGPAPDGFLVQFNRHNTPKRTIQMSSGTPSDIGSILYWRAQVSAQLNPSAGTAGEIKNILLADCLSMYSTGWFGTLVIPCELINPGQTSFAVWERNATLPSGQGSANTWLTNARSQGFQQMYTTYPILNLADPWESSTIESNQAYRCVNR